jgi:uncharacterized protein YvpB
MNRRVNSIFKKILAIILVFSFLLIDQTFSSKPKANDKVPTLATRELAMVKKQPLLEKSKLLDVPLINQMAAPRLYNGCEVTSLAMLLNFHGYDVTKKELADKVKKVPFSYSNGLKGNPDKGFVGDLVHGPGLGVYNGPIYDLAKYYAREKVLNLTGSPFTDLLKKINIGEPVWIITTTRFAPVSVFQNWETPQGKIKITFSEHSVVMTGYDDNHIFINDPYGFKNRKVDRKNFEKAWVQMGKQAIVIEDKFEK